MAVNKTRGSREEFVRDVNQLCVNLVELKTIAHATRNGAESVGDGIFDRAGIQRISERKSKHHRDQARGGSKGRVTEGREQTGFMGIAAEKSIFFFQAEDGIRDLYVTGVQTCALPI